MSPRRPLILDLDGTLLHVDTAPGSIVVPGRTRPSYLSGATLAALGALSDRFDVVLATARSSQGTRPVLDGLAQQGIRVAGVVLEDGGLFGPPEAGRPLETHRRWDVLRAAIDRACDPSWPEFEWQMDYTACLVARTTDAATATSLAPPLLRRAALLEPFLRSFRDGRKVYLAGSRSDKWNALQALLGDRAAAAVGIGDGANDLCWLSRVAFPCSLAGGDPEVARAVIAGGGILSLRSGHEGVAELLARISQLPHD